MPFTDAVVAGRRLRRRDLVAAALLALVAGSAAIVASAVAAPTSVTFAATASATLAAAAWLLLRRTAGHERDWLRPIDGLLQTLDDMRRNRPEPAPAIESGAPAMCALARAVDGARVAIQQRQRVSQVQLMSIEAAFDRIHAVVQALAEAVLLVDLHGRVVLANTAARRLLHEGLSQPVEGRRVLDVVATELRDKLAVALAQVREQRRHKFEITGLQVGDRVFDLAVADTQSARIEHSLGILVTLVDVTRNHEIARLKDEFLSTISHELRTPLTNICAFAELLGQLGPDDEKNWGEFVDIVTAESQRLQRLVEDLLEHGRLQRGDVDWQVVDVDVGRAVREVVQGLQGRAQESGIELTLASSSESLHARADEDRLRQVLARLLDNALKFTPPEGRIRVTATSLGEVVEVTVADSGDGIPLEHRETVFERFRQIGEVLTDKPAGVGLGLPICRGLIDGMHGALWCDESDLGGACFRFVLPALDAPLIGADDHATAAELRDTFLADRSTGLRHGDGGCWPVDPPISEGDGAPR